eukprot:TRINITY_DN4392_c0_g3_i2.p2 TRINITY_DN4392_c0_g3~~TRINITY_DN4392_c0_g3_i2.p2  ORF type:complete len:182 (-),score=49.45 TRINITY_DN4392_c0_g3_i2:151-696(-)
MEKKKEAQVVKKAREVQASMKPIPQISKNSQKIISQSKYHAPLYKRLQQVLDEHQMALRKLKIDMNSRKQSEKPIKLSKTQAVKKKDLCFDPETIKSAVLKHNPLKELASWKETTEDIEFKANCTFRPNVNKTQDTYSKFNLDNRPVLERLTEKRKPLGKSQLMNYRKSRTPIRQKVGHLF